MSKIIYREIKKSDLKQIELLMQTSEELDEQGAKHRIKLLEWIAFHNPNSEGLATYFVAEDAGKIIGHVGRMPVYFLIKGKTIRGYYNHDLYVTPEYRQKGLGLFITMSLYSMAEENSDSFICGKGPNTLNSEMFRRRFYKELSATKFQKILNPRKLLDPRGNLHNSVITMSIKIIAPIIRILSNAIDFVLLNFPRTNIPIKKVERFDDRFDDFNKLIGTKVRFMTHRSSSYLNWKYVDRPNSHFKILAAERNNQIIGYIVFDAKLAGDFRTGTIFELISDPNDLKTIAALCRESIKYFKSSKAYSINCCMPDKRFSRILKKYLFLKNPSLDPIFFTNLDKYKNDDLMDINKWYFSFGDSDGSMFEELNL